MIMKRTQVGVSIILLKKDKVLIGKRRGSHGAGLYALPGGHIEFGETYTETCQRELKEETGIDSALEFSKLGFSEDFFPVEDKHYTTLYFYCRVSDNIEAINMEPDKCDGWKWVSMHKLPEVMYCDTKAQIEKLG